MNHQTTAMLIIDLQNDFLHPDGAYATGGANNPSALLLPEKVLKVAQQVKAHDGLVISSLFTLWPDSHGNPMISDHLRKLRPFLKKGDFAPNSWGQQNVALIDAVVDVSVCKVAYSAFFNTQLDWILKHAAITRLIICGIVTNGGVASSVRDAHLREYESIVLSDGCAAFHEDVHLTSIKDMSNIAQIMTCDEALHLFL